MPFRFRRACVTTPDLWTMAKVRAVRAWQGDRQRAPDRVRQVGRIAEERFAAKQLQRKCGPSTASRKKAFSRITVAHLVECFEAPVRAT